MLESSFDIAAPNALVENAGVLMAFFIPSKTKAKTTTKTV
ncbi:hypothetical protein H4S14_002643 [Agrobacterium vitis]|nr:hypothetical protein [Agrobacterium vitis]MBE1438886.1 hypothetical protein [Agrobacterium vitis]